MHLGKIEDLKSLTTIFSVYGPEGIPQNLACLMFMSCVKVIETLTLTLGYPQVSSLWLLLQTVIVRIMFDLDGTYLRIGQDYSSDCPVSMWHGRQN